MVWLHLSFGLAQHLHKSLYITVKLEEYVSVTASTSRGVPSIPASEMLMILGVLVQSSIGAGCLEEITELLTGFDHLAEEEANCIRHLNLLGASSLGENEQVIDGQGSRLSLLNGAVTDEPSDDSTRVLFVLDVQIVQVSMQGSATAGILSNSSHVDVEF